MYNITQYIKKTFYEDDDIKIVLEEADGHLLAHLTIFKASKLAIKKAQEVWEEIKHRAYWMGYEQIYTYTKDLRMLNLFPDGKIIGEDNYGNERYTVIQWDLK